MNFKMTQTTKEVKEDKGEKKLIEILRKNHAEILDKESSVG